MSTTLLSHDELFASIRDLVMRHSPSGVEAEVDELLKERFASSGLEARMDAAGNLIVRIQGQSVGQSVGKGAGKIAITAHKDEIGCIVIALEKEGRLRVRKLGGSFPWVYGEGVVDLLGDFARVSGVLSFGSRHVSHASPQFVH